MNLNNFFLDRSDLTNSNKYNNKNYNHNSSNNNSSTKYNNKNYSHNSNIKLLFPEILLNFEMEMT